MNDWAQPECYGNVGTATALLAGGLALNAALGIILFILTGYLHVTRARTTISRIYLGRCLVMTQTSSCRFLFYLAYLMDSLNMIILVTEFVFLPTVKAHCKDSIIFFYDLTIALHCFTVIRIFLFWVHFKPVSRPFYKWLKRKFECLRSIEGEQRLVLEVWHLEAYLRRLKSEVGEETNENTLNASVLRRSLTLGSADTIRNLNEADIECSICLEKIQDGNTLV